MKNNIVKLKVITLILLYTLVFCTSSVHAWQSDNGDGTYTNPPLYADFPDPDIIRVGGDFYFVTTTFANVPGLTLLHSQDLVSWDYVSHVVRRLDGREQYDLKNGSAYRSGIFAPSLRYHKGTFYVAVTPVGQNTRIYYSTDPQGPWNHYELDRGAFDPGLFMDDDGTGYIVTSGGWDGTITLLTLNEDFSKVVRDRKIHYNKGAEGSKLIKRGDWYYLFNAIPSRLGMTVSRAKSLFGPWETKNQIDDRTGGHQGALVDLPDGTWYGFVMKDCGPIGRMTHISPVFWQDDWPVWGTPDAPGRVPDIAPKPIQGKPILRLAACDEFDSDTLGLQWQWNHNPDDAFWSLTERPGFLRLRSTQSAGFWTARNTLTQKGQGPWSRGEVKFDLAGLKPGDICGFGTLGKFSGHIAVNCGKDEKLFLTMNVIEDTTSGIRTDTRVASEPVQSKIILFRTEMDFKKNKGLCSYSLDSKTWTLLGGEFDLAYDWRTGTFQGPQYAVFCYNPTPDGGFVDVDSFTFSDSRNAAKPRPVAFDRFEYTGTDPVTDAQIKAGQYRNPILAGFHPDPSLCRVGNDYYLINSTFEYFPGLPVFRSTDLVNWKQIGHVIHRPEQLGYKNRRISGGLFAPAITCHNGLFYVICTMVDGLGNFVVTAVDPAGPWSDPIALHFEGIDPSLFFDDDGRAWIVNNGAPEGKPLYNGHRAIWIQEFDFKTNTMIGPRKVLVNGGVDISQKPVWIEGPHLYKRNGWYYLCCAEGGTGDQHSQVIFRSRNAEGPYSPWDKNPILTQRNLKPDVPNAVTCTGHADLEIGPDGNWWAVFLAVRPYKGGFSPMGRETFLLPVTWTDDDWPIILPSEQRVPMSVKAPAGAILRPSALSPLNGSFTWRDDFKQKNLSLEWIMLRQPKEPWWKIDSAAGKLELIPRPEKLYDAGNPSYLGRRIRHDTYTAALTVEVPQDEGISAGMALFMNERYHYFLAVNRHNDQTGVYLECVKQGQASQVAAADLPLVNTIELRVKVDKAVCSFQYKPEGRDWQTLVDNADAAMISFTVPDGMFLGATVGPHVRMDDKLPPPLNCKKSELKANGNPIFHDAFTADPTPLVVGDTLYLYVGHDQAHGDEMFTMKEWLCYSTQDMKTWTAHGPIMKPTDFKWAVGDAWASQVIEKGGKFYFYTTIQHGPPHVGKAIGVAVADSPTGPFKDARGSALVTDDTTPSDKPWNDIDPTVFIDDDGTACMAWGNPYLYFAKLKSNMIELDGEIQKIDLPNYTEGPWLHKRGNTYYLTYAAFAHQGTAEKICYATAAKITDPWTYQGILTGFAKNSYTIHPGIAKFKGRWYFFYHNAALTLNGETGALGRRSVCAEYLYYNPDGTMVPITQTTDGISISPKK